MSHLVEKEFFEYDDEVMDCANCSSSCYNLCAESCNFPAHLLVAVLVLGPKKITIKSKEK